MEANGGIHGELTFFALTGDIVSSRDLPDRAEVQRTLRAALEELNRKFADILAAPLKVVAGDEVQALLLAEATGGEAILDIVVRIADDLHPATMTWGLGLGPLATDLEEDVSLVDGPCLHRARNALNVAGSEDRWLSIEGVEEPHGDVLSALFDAMGAIRSRWTETQTRYVREARRAIQAEVAERLGVSRQAVSKSLDAASFSSIAHAEDAARALLGWVGTHLESDDR